MSMKLEFTKMQGAGNDFVVLDGIRQSINPTPELIRALADRRFGIGADQVLLLEAAKHEGEPLRYRIFNNTGGEVEQCGKVLAVSAVLPLKQAMRLVIVWTLRP